MPDRSYAAAAGVGILTVAVFAPALRHDLVLLDPIELVGVPALGPGTNLVLHAANAGLVLLLLVRLTGTLLPSVLATLLFAVHPLRVESIVWIASGHDLLGITATLVTLLAYEAWVRRSGSWRYAAAVVAYAAAVTATPLATPLPLVLLLLDGWLLARLDMSRPLHDPRLGRRFLEKLPFALLAVASFAFAPAVPAEPAPLGMLVATGFADVVRYVSMTLVPLGLTPLRPATAPPWWAPGAVIAVVATTVAVLAALRRVPAVALGWLWFLIGLLPVLGRTPADRFTYFPAVGLAIVLASVAAAERRRGALVAAALVATVACIGLTVRQIGFWRDEETILRRALAVTEDNFLAERSLGALLAARGAFEEAAGHIAEAVRLRPDDPEAQSWLGAVRLHEGHLDAAVEALTGALAARPDLTHARMNLARAELRRGRIDEAIVAYRAVLAGAPDDAAVHVVLGRALRQRGTLAEARVHFERALVLGAPPAEVLGPLAQTLAEAGDLDAAAERYRTLLALAPDDAGAHHRLGTVAARLGDLELAEAEYRAALRLRPDLAEARLHLGTVLAARGALAEAVAAYDAALALAPRLASAQYNRALVLEATGDRAAARAALRAELAVQPNWPPALLRLAVLLVTDGAAERAEADALVERAAASLGADDPEVAAARRLLTSHPPVAHSP